MPVSRPASPRRKAERAARIAAAGEAYRARRDLLIENLKRQMPPLTRYEERVRDWLYERKDDADVGRDNIGWCDDNDDIDG